MRMNGSDYRCMSHVNSTIINDINLDFLQNNVISLIFLILCFVTGLVGNVAVLLVYHRHFNPTNYKIYVLFLAYIDIVFCVSTLPFYILNISFHNTFVWDAVCRMGCFMTTLLSLASLVILVIVAIDRYIVVRKPMRGKLSQKHAVKSCTTALVLAGILSWYSILLYGVREERVDGNMVSNCTSVHKLSKINSYILLSCSILLTSFFGVTYGGIWSKIRVHARRTSASYNHRRKTIVIYIAITGVFSVTTIVTVSINIVRESFYGPLYCIIGTTGDSVLMTFSLAHCLNHIVNPLIYYWRDHRFRKVLKHIFDDKFTSILLTRDSTRSTTSRKGSFSVESMSKKGSFSVESMSKKGSFSMESMSKKERLSVDSTSKIETAV